MNEQTAIVKSVDDLTRISKLLSQSGYFEDAKDMTQCAVKVMAGTEMGFGAFASMTGIHIIKGKPTIGANLMASAIKRSGRYNYRVLQHDATICKIAFYEKWDGKIEEIGISEMTMTEAKAANLNMEWDKIEKKWKEKHNWKSFPKNMLFARAISNGVKWFCPDVFDGTVAYTPDEMGASEDADGNAIIDVTPRNIAAVPSPPKDIEREQLLSELKAIRIQLGKEPDEVLDALGVKSIDKASKDQIKGLIEFYKTEQEQDIAVPVVSEVAA